MLTTTAPELPTPTEAEIHALRTCLASNAHVARLSGDARTRDAWEGLQNTLEAVLERAQDLSKVTRVVVATDTEGKVLEQWDAYANGCFATTQDDGRTLKILPMPAEQH